MSGFNVPHEWFARDPNTTHSFDYDLVVIGGGSGGLAAGREAAKLGQRVIIFDFVSPSGHGTTWGLGGTCVNVGCIPKKLMHAAALYGEALRDAKAYGWEMPENGVQHNWENLVSGVQDHIGSINWGYKTALNKEKVVYVNAKARFEDAHTVVGVDRRGKETRVTGRRILIAVGGRPKVPSDVPGAELGITSDDLFSLPQSPGKTLCVGASYVSLECAGFLAGLGLDVTVMVRSILLRGFDEQCAALIGNYMEGHGVKFIRGAVPAKLEKTDAGKVRVHWGQGQSEEYDTVMWAVGREAVTGALALDKAGLTTLPNGKLQGDHERTAVPHIYAIGDNLEGFMELTPVAIAQGRRLCHRLYEPGYTLGIVNRCIPTTVFTPLEYGCVGLTEEEARAKFPAEGEVDVVHTNYQPLEWTVSHRPENVCYLKLIYHTADCNRILGFHLLGPNAGEITQGFAIAMGTGKGTTLDEVQRTIGIHPTCAEEVTTASVTKSSGEDTAKSGC